MSLRCVRSPDAPKMTSENGSSVYGMTPELVAESGQQPVRERIVAARAEAREERSGDGRRRYRFFHGVLDGPAPFARVVHVRPQIVELRIGGEGSRRQLEEPRADDGALV